MMLTAALPSAAQTCMPEALDEAASMAAMNKLMDDGDAIRPFVLEPRTSPGDRAFALALLEAESGIWAALDTIQQIRIIHSGMVNPLDKINAASGVMVYALHLKNLLQIAADKISPNLAHVSNVGLAGLAAAMLGHVREMQEIVSRCR